MATVAYWQDILTKLEAVIAGKATEDVLEYEIGDRRLRKMTPAELSEFYQFAKKELAQARQADPLTATRNKIVTRF
jgi:hypothetical protein